MLKTMNVKNNI